MSFLNKMRDLMLGTEIDEEYEYEDEMIEEGEDDSVHKARTEFITGRNSKKTENNNVVNMPANTYTQPAREHVIISQPKVIDDAPAISDYLKQNMTCVVNLEGIENLTAQRIADFLGGAAYSLSCAIERVSNEIFIIAPNHVELSNEMKEEIKNSSGSILPWISSTFK